MSQILTKNDCKKILKIMEERNLEEFCLGCDISWNEDFLEGGICQCDNDE